MAEIDGDWNGSSSEEENLDPRIQEELECLNSASNEINTLETEVDNARTKFRSLLGESTQKLNVLYKKTGNCINKVRPYFELMKEFKKAQLEAQRAVVNYQRAIGVYRAAMETVQLAETRAVDETAPKRDFDQAWQEVLNHATMRFMESEVEKTKSEEEHLKRASEVETIQKQMIAMEKKWNRTIPKSRPYFEQKDKFELQLEQEKVNVEDLQRALNASKQRYKGALDRLEAISNSVHEKRRKHIELPPRTPGVGAESCESTSDLPSINLEVISHCSDEAFEDFDDDDLDINLDVVSVCSEGKEKEKKSSNKAIMSHRRHRSCDVKALITSANRTTSVDEGYGASTSSTSFCPEANTVPANNQTSEKEKSSLECCVAATTALVDEKSLETVSDDVPQTQNSQTYNTQVADSSSEASTVQDLSKVPLSETAKQPVKKQIPMKPAVQDVTNIVKKTGKKPNKLQTKAGLPLLDIATLSKDRTYTF